MRRMTSQEVSIDVGAFARLPNSVCNDEGSSTDQYKPVECTHPLNIEAELKDEKKDDQDGIKNKHKGIGFSPFFFLNRV